MLLTLDWMIHHSNLHSFRCLACADQLDRIITSVNILDNPDVIKWIKQDELVLTTGFIFKDDAALQIETLRDLKRTGCAALCIKIRRFFTTIPQYLIDESEKIGLVLIEAPYYYSFSDISQLIYQEMVYEKLSDQQLQVMRLGVLSDLYFKNVGLQDLVREVSFTLKRSVFVLNGRMESLCMNVQTPEGELFREQKTLSVSEGIVAPNREMAAGGNAGVYYQTLMLNDVALRCLVCRLPSPGGMTLMPADADLTPADIEYFYRAAQYFFVDVRKNQIVNQEMHTYYDAFFNLLRAPGPKDPGQIMDICASYGFNTVSRRVCVLFEIDLQNSQPARAHQVGFLRDALIDYMKNDAAFFSCCNQDVLCAFFFYDESPANSVCVDRTRRIAEDFLAKASGELYINACASVSRCHSDIDAISTAYHDCVQTMEMRRMLDGKQQVATHLHYMPYMMLNQCSREELTKIYQDTVESLARYDRDNNTELVRTVRAYFENKFNAAATSKSLFLHRNTLNNRLERAESILGVDFQDSEDAYSLYMGLCACRLLEAGRKGGR